MLAIRKSAALFRLHTASDVQSKVRFLNTGVSQVPGLIVMSLQDAMATDGTTDVVVLFNASDEQQVFSIPGYAGRGMRLHPVQVSSADTLVRSASFTASGDFTVPARTTAVFVNAQATGPDAGTPDAGTQPGTDGGTDPGDNDPGGGCGCTGTNGGALGALALLLASGLLSRRRQQV
jgi:uncharacterized protein (TIGR03382 family)